MKKLLPILLLVLGTGAGLGAGFALRPAADVSAASETEHGAPQEASHDKASAAKTVAKPGDGQEYIALEDQFIIPVVKDGLVNSLILATLTVEAQAGSREFIFSSEPKLRDALLQVMFDHANAGGFAGAFTNSSKLDRLRETFVEVSQTLFGDVVTDILIVEITRQDI